jgi:hypothetical protein
MAKQVEGVPAKTRATRDTDLKRFLRMVLETKKTYALDFQSNAEALMAATALIRRRRKEPEFGSVEVHVRGNSVYVEVRDVR